MAKEELTREIDNLKVQVDDLQSHTQEAVDPPVLDESQDRMEKEEGPPQEEYPDFTEIQKYLTELLETLEHEFKSVPAIPAVVLFGLGVLVGRHLSR